MDLRGSNSEQNSDQNTVIKPRPFRDKMRKEEEGRPRWRGDLRASFKVNSTELEEDLRRIVKQCLHHLLHSQWLRWWTECSHTIQTLEDKELALCFLRKLLSQQPSEISSPSLALLRAQEAFLQRPFAIWLFCGSQDCPGQKWEHVEDWGRVMFWYWKSNLIDIERSS